MYFNNCKNLDEAKNLFRTLCIKLHPDTSGADTQAEFVKMYQEFKKYAKNNNTNDENNDFETSKFYNLLKNFDTLKDIKINFIGSFIWLEDDAKGATYLQREILKSIKLEGYNSVRFAPLKKMWYFSPVDYIQKSKSFKSLDELKTTYGGQSFKAKGATYLTS